MKTISAVRIVALAAMLWCFAGQAEEPKPRSADYEPFLASAHRLLKGGQLAEAGQAAATLIMHDDKRYEGYVLAAKIAGLQGQTNQAVGFAQQALKLAPAERKDQVKQLLASLARDAYSTPPDKPSPLEEEFRDHLKAAEQATADGLPFKALREFTAAVNASPSHAEIGLKAAKLWLDRGEIMEAVRLLNLMKTQKLEPAVEAEANQILKDQEMALAKIFQEETAAGWAVLDQGETDSAGLTNAAAHFRDAIQARYFVNNYSGSALDAEHSPFMGLALSAAASGDATNAIQALKLASKAGLRVEGSYFASPLWRPVIKDRVFQQFLKDAFGDQIPEAAVAATANTMKDFIGKWEFLPPDGTKTEDGTYKYTIEFGLSENGSLALTQYNLKDFCGAFHDDFAYPPGTGRQFTPDGVFEMRFTFSFETRYIPGRSMVEIIRHPSMTFSSLAGNVIASVRKCPDETILLALDSTKTKLLDLTGYPPGNISDDEIKQQTIMIKAGVLRHYAVKIPRE